MAGFADLPNELVLEVLEMVLPEDLENFVQMSKHVFLIARPVLESHRQLIRLHTRFFSSHLPPEQGLHTEERDGFSVGRVPALFKAIINDRRIGHYIREVILDRLLRLRSKMLRNYSDEERALYNQQRNLVNTAVAQSGVPAIQSFYDLHITGNPTSRNSREELLVALILPLLPNLNSLILVWNPGMRYLPRMIRHCALDGNPWLANLKTVHLRECYGVKGARLRDLSLFNSLPALKSLTAAGIHEGGENDEFLPAEDSHTNELKLLRIQVPTLPLYWYLESFHNLQTFTFEYAHRVHSVVDQKQFDPCWIRAALLARAKTTLEILTILGPTRPDPFMGSLQAFGALWEIHTQWVFLFPKQSCHLTWPSRVLPASLRRLKLNNVINRTPMYYMSFFRGLQRARESTCPHLELVTIVTYWNEVEKAEELDELSGFCKEEGMSLTFQEYAEWREDPGALMFLTFGAES